MFDLHGEPVASLIHDAAIEDTRELWEDAARERLIDESVPGGFGVWLPRSAERVEYRVARAPDGRGWSIEERSRTKHIPEDLDEAAGPTAKTLELELLSDVKLEAPAAKSGLFESIHAFGFDDLGRLLVQKEDGNMEGAVTCLVATPEGEVILERRFELPLADRTSSVQWWPFETGRWLVTVNWMDEYFEPYGKAWWADPSTGELTELTQWPLSTIDGIASTRDGGFVACGGSIERSMHITNFGSFDADGSARWLHRGPSVTVGLGDYFMPDDVAVTSEGHVVTISSVGERLQIFGLDGAWRESIELASVWEEPPGYPSSIQADPLGAVIVVDAQIEPSVRRLQSDGTVREAVSPRREDGSMDSAMPYRVRVAPDGRLWTTDGYVLMRLGADGTADRTLGRLPSRDELVRPGPILIDRRTKRIAIQDRRSRTLHVFDAGGARLFVARPEAGDYDDGSYYGKRLAFAPDGRVFVSSITLPERWLAFDLDGKRIGPADLGGGGVVFGAGGRRWVVTLHRAELIDAAGIELGAIERRADRSWLSGIADLDVAPDGSVAVLDRPKRRDVRRVSVYAPDGTPKRDFPLPPSESGQWQVRHGGDWIVVTGYEGPAWLLRVRDATWYRFEPDWMGVASGDVRRTVVPIGSELWCVDPFARRLRRYALPKE